jgi:ElaB/YqjD/DUF883 family membrane-anchored ribosome-binding protein
MATGTRNSGDAPKKPEDTGTTNTPGTESNRPMTSSPNDMSNRSTGTGPSTTGGAGSRTGMGGTSGTGDTSRGRSGQSGMSGGMGSTGMGGQTGSTMGGGMDNMTTEPPPKVAEAIDEVSDKAKEVVDRASESLKHTTANAAMQLQQAQHAMVDRAYEAKAAASTQLRQLAEKLRSEVRTGEGQPVQYADQLSTSLDTLAQYLEMHSFDQIEGDLRRTIQRNPWQSVGLSVFVGWILAKIFRR